MGSQPVQDSKDVVEVYQKNTPQSSTAATTPAQIPSPGNETTQAIGIDTATRVPTASTRSWTHEYIKSESGVW
jgi:hypothetical protein